jgi:hypothetical protein
MHLAPLANLAPVSLANINACQTNQTMAWYDATLDNQQLGNKCLAMITNPLNGNNRVTAFSCDTQMPVLCEANGAVVLVNQKS